MFLSNIKKNMRKHLKKHFPTLDEYEMLKKAHTHGRSDARQPEPVTQVQL